MQIRPKFFDQLQLALGILALVLVVASIVFSLVNRNLQRSVRQQQIKINNGKVTQQVASNIVRDLAQISVRDPEITSLLKKHGFDVKLKNNNAGSSAESTPATPSSNPTR